MSGEGSGVGMTQMSHINAPVQRSDPKTEYWIQIKINIWNIEPL